MYDKLKNIPTSRDGKMIYGIFAAFVARAMLNSGIALFPTDPDGAGVAFLMAGLMVYTVILAMVRFDSGEPLFAPLKRRS